MPAPLSILLVDDEPLILELLAEALVDRGHRVATFTQAGAALAALAPGAFDVAVLDQFLGDSRGIDLMRLLAARDPRIRCVIMTGGAERSLVDEARGAGAAAVLLKPVFPDELCSVLERVAAGDAGGG